MSPHSSSPQVTGLTGEGCHVRRRRLADRMQARGLAGALLTDRRHVYYLCGYWAAAHHAPLLLVRADGSSHAVIPDASAQTTVVAEAVSSYRSHHGGTLVPDQFGAAFDVISPSMTTLGTLGVDSPLPILVGGARLHDVSADLLALRRCKLDDEVSLIRQAIRACEAAYTRATAILRPGIREIDVFAEAQSAAVRELGEPIGDFGNDFQSGTPGGPPRVRAVEVGELMPLDMAVTARGYRCDLCRTFVIGAQPSAKQAEAGRRVREVLEFVEATARVGTSCRQLHATATAMLDGVNGWRFFHHLGHGTGLSPHEAPYLNAEWDDELQAGDVFTVEPGLYHEELLGGVRLEQNYWLSTDGLHRLSSFPLGW